MRHRWKFLIVAAVGAGLLFCDLAPAGPLKNLFSRRKQRQQQHTGCVGPNCYQHGPGGGPGQLSVNGNGGFEGQLPSQTYAQYLAAQQGRALPQQAPAAPPQPPHAAVPTGPVVPTLAQPRLSRSLVVAAPPRSQPSVTVKAAEPSVNDAASKLAKIEAALDEARAELARAQQCQRREASLKATELEKQISLLKLQQTYQIEDLLQQAQKLQALAAPAVDPGPAPK